MKEWEGKRQRVDNLSRTDRRGLGVLLCDTPTEKKKKALKFFFYSSTFSQDEWTFQCRESAGMKYKARLISQGWIVRENPQACAESEGWGGGLAVGGEGGCLIRPWASCILGLLHKHQSSYLFSLQSLWTTGDCFVAVRAVLEILREMLRHVPYCTFNVQLTFFVFKFSFFLDMKKKTLKLIWDIVQFLQ